MSNTLLISLLVLGVLGAVLAVILYFVAQKFKVEENPLIDEAEACLPGANCGGCGFAGCRALAEACVKQAAEKGNIAGLACPGTDMNKVAAVLGLTAGTFEPKIAVVRCNGSCQNSPAKVHYEGADICAFASTLYAGKGGCSKGCMGLGDCVKKCNFGALHIDKETGLPVVDPDKCVGCGVCAKTCPRNIIEIRPRVSAAPTPTRAPSSSRTAPPAASAAKSASRPAPSKPSRCTATWPTSTRPSAKPAASAPRYAPAAPSTPSTSRHASLKKNSLPKPRKPRKLNSKNPLTHESHKDL